MNNTQLCNLLSSNFPFQAPFGLKIHPLPKEIVSWVASLLQFHPQKEQWSKELVRSEFAHGITPKLTSSQLGLEMMTTSTASTKPRNTKFSAPSLSQSEKKALVIGLPSFSNQIRSEPSWMAWHRPSGWLANLTPNWTPKTNLHSFYNDNLDDASTDPGACASIDPGESPQVAITGSVLRKFNQLAISTFDKALCSLFIGTFFFAMRSCEYVKVQRPRRPNYFD